MAYTINFIYNKILDEIDKRGSDFMTVERVMDVLETETYNFLGETLDYLESTEKISNDIRTLYKPYSLNVIPDPNDSNFKAVALPEDYQHLYTAEVIDPFTFKTRKMRHGSYQAVKNDPNKKATAEHPVVVVYDNYMRIYTALPSNPTKVEGLYVSKPIFGDPDGEIDEEICVNLPDSTVQVILKKMIRSIFGAIGDERSVLSRDEDLGYRVKGK